MGFGDTVEVSKGSKDDRPGIQRAMDWKPWMWWALLGRAEGQGQSQDTPPVNPEAKPESPGGPERVTAREQGHGRSVVSGWRSCHEKLV